MHTAADLKHPNLVALLGAGKLGGLCWIAMEFVEGESLAKVMAKSGVAGMLDWTYAVRVAVQIARASRPRISIRSSTATSRPATSW